MLYLKLVLIIITCALLPLYVFIQKSKNTSPKHKIMYFTGLIAFITFDLIVFGAFTRLTDSGLGCPDWPGCFAKSNPFSADHHIELAQVLSPHGAVTSLKAWIEMIHRYIAATVGFLIIVLNVITFKYRKQIKIKPYQTFLLLVLIILQGAFGAWTVTLKLQPAIVSVHLLLAVLLILSIISLYCIQKNAYEPEYFKSVQSLQVTPNENISYKYKKLMGLVGIGIVLVIIQICLGAWVSSNYAMLGCTEFPACIKGQIIPQISSIYWEQAFHIWRELGRTYHGDVLTLDSLTAIHFVHRCMAFVVFVYLTCMYLYIHKNNSLSFLNKWVKISFSILLLQIVTGISTAIFTIPLAAALIHSAGATLLIGSLVYIYWYLYFLNQAMFKKNKNN